MIYRLFWCLANIAIRVFYGKIEVSGIESIPKDGPLLIASNHPNGFLEPIIMACLFPRPLHFMVRGDVFNKPWLRPILLHTNQIPIFRFKDGFSELRKNDASLREAYKALDQDAAIILFIEGGTQPVKTLRPFQKGLARMANSYLDVSKNDKPLQILPVAINFVSPFIQSGRTNGFQCKGKIKARCIESSIAICRRIFWIAFPSYSFSKNDTLALWVY